VKPTTSIIVSMEYAGQVVSDEVRYIVSHNDPTISETSSFWYNVLAHEEFRQALASVAIYNRDSLPKFGMQLLQEKELTEMGLPLETQQLLLQKFSGTLWTTIANLTQEEAKRIAPGFNAGIYYDHITGKAVLTFQGSNLPWEEPADWIDNFLQGAAFSTYQYNNALKLGASLFSVYGSGTAFVTLEQSTPGKPTDIMMTGHSLGGGLASTATLVSGFRANTFNAAGLSSNTITEAANLRSSIGGTTLVNPENLVMAYRTENDALNTVQYPLGLMAFGERIVLQDHNWMPLTTHSMIYVLYGFMYRYKYEL